METVIQQMQQQLADQAVLIQQLQARDADHVARQNALAEQHAEGHRTANSALQAAGDLANRVTGLTNHVQTMGSGYGGGGAKPGQLVSAKFCRPDKFGDKSEGLEGWKTWSHKLMRFVGAQDLSYKSALLKAALQKNAAAPIQVGDLTSGYGITNEQDQQLQSLLVDACYGKALSLILVIEKENGTGLEMWRRLEGQYNPDTMNRALLEGRRLLNPGTGKTWSEVSRILMDWDAALSEKRLRDGTDGIDDTMKLSILYSMIPPEKARAAWESGQYRSVDRMRSRIEDMIRNFTNGVAPMHVGNIEDDDQPELLDEDGELYRLERDARGKWQKVQHNRKPYDQKRGAGTGDAKVCFGCGEPGHMKATCPKAESMCKRCGRKGHEQKKCWAVFHLDRTKIAGAPPAKKPEKSMNSLEEANSGDDEELPDLGLVDICALEEADPWETFDHGCGSNGCVQRYLANRPEQSCRT